MRNTRKFQQVIGGWLAQASRIGSLQPSINMQVHGLPLAENNVKTASIFFNRGVPIMRSIKGTCEMIFPAFNHTHLLDKYF